MLNQTHGSKETSGDTGNQGLSWISILRLGLVQASLGSIIVLTTSTLNRVMVVELSLAALVPGLLVGLHYAVQLARPLWGHGSDAGRSRTPWIVGGMAVLGAAGTAAAATTFLFASNPLLAMALAALAFLMIGAGVGAAGTSLLALLASRTAPGRRPAAASMVWLMMIAGIAITAIITGKLLDPFSLSRLVAVTAATALISVAVTGLAVFGIEKGNAAVTARASQAGAATLSFRESLRQTWTDGDARLFTFFVFISMLAYSMQDLILEPFAGLSFGMSPGQTTALSGIQHGGVFLGMAGVGIIGSLFPAGRGGLLRMFTMAGCAGSALTLIALAIAARMAPEWPLTETIFLLGVFNGIFAVAAIGTMMMLAGAGGGSREGIRMGLWGAAQGISFGLGGLLGTLLVDIARAVLADTGTAFALVFLTEASLFLIAVFIAARMRPAGGRDEIRGGNALRVQPAE